MNFKLLISHQINHVEIQEDFHTMSYQRLFKFKAKKERLKMFKEKKLILEIIQKAASFIKLFVKIKKVVLSWRLISSIAIFSLLIVLVYLNTTSADRNYTTITNQTYSRPLSISFQRESGKQKVSTIMSLYWINKKSVLLDSLNVNEYNNGKVDNSEILTSLSFKNDVNDVIDAHHCPNITSSNRRHDQIKIWDKGDNHRKRTSSKDIALKDGEKKWYAPSQFYIAFKHAIHLPLDLEWKWKWQLKRKRRAIAPIGNVIETVIPNNKKVTDLVTSSGKSWIKSPLLLTIPLGRNEGQIEDKTQLLKEARFSKDTKTTQSTKMTPAKTINDFSSKESVSRWPFYFVSSVTVMPKGIGYELALPEVGRRKKSSSVSKGSSGSSSSTSGMSWFEWARISPMAKRRPRRDNSRGFMVTGYIDDDNDDNDDNGNNDNNNSNNNNKEDDAREVASRLSIGPVRLVLSAIARRDTTSYSERDNNNNNNNHHHHHNSSSSIGSSSSSSSSIGINGSNNNDDKYINYVEDSSGMARNLFDSSASASHLPLRLIMEVAVNESAKAVASLSNNLNLSNSIASSTIKASIVANNKENDNLETSNGYIDTKIGKGGDGATNDEDVVVDDDDDDDDDDLDSGKSNILKDYINRTVPTHSFETLTLDHDHENDTLSSSITDTSQSLLINDDSTSAGNIDNNITNNNESFVIGNDNESEVNQCDQYLVIKNSGIESTSLKVILSIIYAIILTIGLIGNTITLYALRRKEKRSPIDYFIGNLALSDIMLCIFAVPITPIYLLGYGFWPFGAPLCKAFAFAQGSSVYISSFTLIAIAYVRYCLIVYPHKPTLSEMSALFMNILTWVLGILVCLPYLLHVGLYPDDCPTKFCDENWGDSLMNRFYFSVVTLTLQFFVPFVFVSFFYGSIFRKLRNQRLKREQQRHQHQHHINHHHHHHNQSTGSLRDINIGNEPLSSTETNQFTTAGPQYHSAIDDTESIMFDYDKKRSLEALDLVKIQHQHSPELDLTISIAEEQKNIDTSPAQLPKASKSVFLLKSRCASHDDLLRNSTKVVVTVAPKNSDTTINAQIVEQESIDNGAQPKIGKQNLTKATNSEITASSIVESVAIASLETISNIAVSRCIKSKFSSLSDTRDSTINPASYTLIQNVSYPCSSNSVEPSITPLPLETKVAVVDKSSGSVEFKRTASCLSDTSLTRTTTLMLNNGNEHNIDHKNNNENLKRAIRLELLDRIRSNNERKKLPNISTTNLQQQSQQRKQQPPHQQLQFPVKKRKRRRGRNQQRLINNNSGDIFALREQRLKDKDKRLSQANLKLLCIVVLFVCSWLPLNLFNLFQDYSEIFSKWDYIKHAFFVTHLIACSSVCYNPILYAWMSDNYRQELTDILQSLNWFKKIFCFKTMTQQ